MFPHIQKDHKGFFLCLVIVSWIFSLPVMAGSQSHTIHIIASKNNSIHKSFTQTLSRFLKRDSDSSAEVSLHYIENEIPAETFNNSNELIISVGTVATAWALNIKHRPPLLATLIPQHSFTALTRDIPASSNQEALSAVFIDQPLTRQIQLLKILFPKSKNIGALFSTHKISTQHEVQRLLAQQNQTLETELLNTDDNPIKPLTRLLNRSDVFIATPDPSIFNRRTLTGILLTTYRHRIPVIGFSQAYVHAGALAATYSSAEQIAQQTSETAIKWLDQPQRTFKQPQHPIYYSIAINEQVARSLGLEKPDADFIKSRLEQLARDHQ